MNVLPHTALAHAVAARSHHGEVPTNAALARERTKGVVSELHVALERLCAKRRNVLKRYHHQHFMSNTIMKQCFYTTFSRDFLTSTPNYGCIGSTVCIGGNSNGDALLVHYSSFWLTCFRVYASLVSSPVPLWPGAHGILRSGRAVVHAHHCQLASGSLCSPTFQHCSFAEWRCLQHISR